MSQSANWSTPLTGPSTPAAFAARTNDSFNALMTNHSGTSRPAYLTANSIWADTSLAGGSPSIVIFKYWDGAQDIELYRVNQTADRVEGPINYTNLGATEDIASASTTNLGSTRAWLVRITGTTTITSFGAVANQYRSIRFGGALTLTHNATSLILPGGANITTAAGDTATAISDGSGNWRLIDYTRADGSTLVPPNTLAGTVPTLLLNPFFEISQERGTSSVTVGPNAGGVSTYSVDQWIVQNRGTMAVGAQQISAPFAVDGFRRLQNALRVTISTAQASLGANDGLTIEQPIEGTHLATLGLGTADARGFDVAMVVSASVTGTYTVYAQNAARDRSWNTNVSLTANTPTVVFVPISALTTGTWVTTTAVAAYIGISLGAGSSLQTSTLDSWQSNGARGHASTTNLSATLSATFTIGFAQAFPTGVLPFTSAGQITGENLARLLSIKRPQDDETRRCQRYWARVFYMLSSAAVNSGAVLYNLYLLPAQLRAASPSTSVTSEGATNSSAAGVTSWGSVDTRRFLALQAFPTAAGSAMNSFGYVDVSARM